MIDWDRVRELFEELGEDSFAEVIDLFCEEVSEGLENLRAADGQGDRAAAFHFLKGAALNLGMVELAHQCSEAEQKANNGANTDALAQHILAGFPVALDNLQRNWVLQTR